MTDILVYTEEQDNVIAGSVEPREIVVAVVGEVGGGSGSGGAVDSVNGQIGHVVLDAADVGADTVGAAASAVAAHVAAVDPHPQYTTVAEAAAAAPVQSVNTQTGAVVLDAADVGADAAGTAAAAVSAHEADTTPHAVITQVDKFGFDTAAAQTAGVGEMVWNAADGTADLGLPGGVTLQVGQEGLIRVLNKTGSTIQNMHVVYITGAQGNRVTAAQAQANNVSADKTLAVATQDIANNAEGFATILGMVRQVNTSAWAEGTELWLSAAVAGAITNVRPTSPNHQVRVGYVVRSHATEGVIYVTVNIGADLSHLHDVVITAPNDNDVLAYDAATQTWRNEPQTGGSGEVNTASNLGAGAGVFASKVAADLQFKSLVAGANVSITSNATTVTVSATGGGGGGGAVDSVNGQTGAVVLDTDDVAEGATNLYFTNARASAAAPVQSVNGQTGVVDLSGSYAPLSHVGSGGAAHANVVAGGAAGFMTGADKSKLDGIAPGAQANVGTDISIGYNPAYVFVSSSTGSDATLDAATALAAGVMSASDKTKLDGVAAGATANADTDSLAEGGTNKYFTEGRVRGTVLTGLSLLTGGVISAADSVLSALGKLQKQITDAVTAIGGKQDTLVSGTNLRTVNGSSLLGSGDLAVSGGGADNSTEVVAISSGALNLSATTKEVIVVDLNQNVTTISMPAGVAGQAVNRRIVFTQSGAANFTVAGWGSVTIEGGTAPVAATGVGAVTEYMLSNTSNGGWRMYVDQGITFAQVGSLGGSRNKLMNGKMDIAQRGGSLAGVISSAYLIDRWFYVVTTSAAVTISQQADAPSGGEFQYSNRIAVTTADASIAAGGVASLQQRIEGFNARDLVGKTFTLSFWVRSSKTGQHCVSFANGVGDRTYVAEYTISAANTWEFKTVTVAGGLTSAGTWDFTTGLGLRVAFALAAGSTYQTTAGAWQTGNFIGTTNQVNCLDTVGNIFAITGVQLEVGTVATPFEHRTIGSELSLCQRYHQRFSVSEQHYATTVFAWYSTFALPVQMRATPTFSLAGAWTPNNVISVSHSATPSAYTLGVVPSANGMCGYVGEAVAVLDAEL